MNIKELHNLLKNKQIKAIKQHTDNFSSGLVIIVIDENNKEHILDIGFNCHEGEVWLNDEEQIDVRHYQ